MREMLALPDTHRIGIVPGSDTGAFEMAMWTMLGARGVTTLAWESFGEGWVTDAVKQLKLEPNVLRADYGRIPDRSEEHTSELQSLMRISYAVFCLKKKKKNN